MDVAKAATLPNAYVFEPKANWGDFARRVESLLSLRFTSVMEMKPGGRPGGEIKFLIGAALTIAGVWLFFDSVRFTTDHRGLISGAISRGRGGGLMETTSMGIVLVPLFIGVIALFFDARKLWGWVLVGVGLVIAARKLLFQPQRPDTSHRPG